MFLPGHQNSCVGWGKGLSFGGDLETRDPMNLPQHGCCYTGDEGVGWYSVKEDKDGNSMLTGEGSGMKVSKTFTI